MEIDGSKLPNASPKPKRLHLEEDDSDGLFHCPVQDCEHDGFTTQRGCRKHAKNTVGSFISTKSQTLLRLKHANNKATKMTPMMTRLHLKSDELSLLTCQAKSLKISCPGLPAMVFFFCKFFISCHYSKTIQQYKEEKKKTLLTI